MTLSRKQPKAKELNFKQKCFGFNELESIVYAYNVSKLRLWG